MRSSVRSVLAPSSAHCQTIIRFQPASRHAASLRRSRLTFFDHFSIQKAMLDFGIVESLQPCLCQKHPRTSIMVFAFGITMSGLPLNLLSHTLKRQPHENSRLRTRISGKVSLPRIRDISLLLCSCVMRSIRTQLPGQMLAECRLLGASPEPRALRRYAAPPPFSTGGFIPAFARCCFCIAASLLVFTSPMTFIKICSTLSDFLWQNCSSCI